MQKTRLEIDGTEVPLTAEYALRFGGEEDTPFATLYKGGKRVTRPWKLSLEINQPADPYGGNANTE